MPILRPALLIVALLIAATVMAYDDGGYSRPSYSNPDADRFRRQDKRVDLLFEKGKAIYARKESAHGKFKYCVISPQTGEPRTIKGKTLKPYDGASYDELARNIRNCKNPDESLADSFDQYDANAVLYYLKKRYKISLVRP